MQGGRTALHEAAWNKHWNVVQVLLERNADPNIASEVRLIMALLTPKANANPYP